MKEKDDVIESVCERSRDETIMDFKEEVRKDSEDELLDFLDEKKEEEEKEEEEVK